MITVGGALRAPTRGVVRPLRSNIDDAGVRRIFRSTVALGRPVGFAVAGWARYESLCLDWYLGAGRADAAVLVAGDQVRGYVLTCTDEGAFERWQRRSAARFATWATGAALSPRLDPDARRFLQLRLRDGFTTWRSGGAHPMPAHVHVNVEPGFAPRVALDLLAHADARVRAAGLPGWYGEVNAPTGRRARALERMVGEVVRRQPNHTLTWLAGRPVERLTVVRTVAPVAPPSSAYGGGGPPYPNRQRNAP